MLVSLPDKVDLVSWTKTCDSMIKYVCKSGIESRPSIFKWAQVGFRWMSLHMVFYLLVEKKEPGKSAYATNG